MFWVVDSLTMRKYKTMKGLDDSCEGGSAKKADSLPWTNGTEESRVRKLNQTFSHKLCLFMAVNQPEDELLLLLLLLWF